MPALATLTLAALAAKAGVDIDTLKSYERLGLVAKPRRTVKGLQLYPGDEAERIVFIKRSIELGFSTAAIREMLGIGRRQAMTCGDIYAIADRQLADIRRRMADLKRMEAALEPLLETCPRRGGLANCTILNALSQPAGVAAGD
ncbi:MAG: MerR family transcriptional regulator [Reyranella sp.]|jgi:DNA-binding transcriptional MerR regulator|nr:MAG: MerR family transcriptional regulator [Reyranella sp.]